jgi:hypothetical protein
LAKKERKKGRKLFARRKKEGKPFFLLRPFPPKIFKRCRAHSNCQKAKMSASPAVDALAARLGALSDDWKDRVDALQQIQKHLATDPKEICDAMASAENALPQSFAIQLSDRRRCVELSPPFDFVCVLQL